MPGCILFVNLWQCAPEDRTHVRLDTGKMPFLRTPDRPGVELMPLFQDSEEYVRLERWAPGAAISVPNPGGMDIGDAPNISEARRLLTPGPLPGDGKVLCMGKPRGDACA
jgi:hypothetical protein